ncbi:PREDICTED: tumor necrosis factor receptor superfamily member 6-like, partial [Acanthisitta chloris]|uniref:tumor necrosis factor receptor superfamily member 6-like n=1 Tax=Acanthisitta chloris TaxID=57068 RepID=UPI0004F0D165
VAVLIIETQSKNNTEGLMHRAHNRRIIARRETNCHMDEYNLGGQCCKKCRSGFVKSIDCPTDISKHCVPCVSGKEYISHLNDAEKCLRCTSCDTELGFEVVKNCTPEENTKCACAKNKYCSPESCDHCIQCTVCESGITEKQCTATSDTVCGKKGTVLKLSKI